MVDELALLDGEPHFVVEGDEGVLQVDRVVRLSEEGQPHVGMGRPEGGRLAM